MEPNQNTAGMPGASTAGQNMAATPVQSATAAPMQGATSESLPKDNMAAAPANEKKKGGSGMVIGLILCLLLAAGGIGFGVWMMMDGNMQKDVMNQQISALKKQNNELQKQIDEGAGLSKNPVIESSKLREDYSAELSFESSLISNYGEIYVVDVWVKNGEIGGCEIGSRTISGGSYLTEKVSDCNISGLDGKVFNVVEFGAGQDNSSNRIGFMMEDGTVKYTLPIFDAIKANDFGVKGSVKIDGIVTGAVDVTLRNTSVGYGGYGATVFILGDGSYVLFDQSMVE